MFVRLSKSLIVAMLAVSIGLHWALLQSVAWVGMVVSYSQNAPLADAFAKTFDGKHPCALCKSIAQGKKSEKKSDLQIQGKKLEFLDAKTPFVFAAPDYFHLLPTPTISFASLARTPPVPPPRTWPG